MKQSFWLKAEDRTEIHVRYWGTEIKDAKGIIQIAHGMVEHIGRYDVFATYLSKQGFIVYGNDHRGHGRTGDKQGLAGYFTSESGFDRVVGDMYLLTGHIQSQHPGLPLFLFGHSMGSFITRNYLQSYSEEPEGVILSGTGTFPYLTSYIGKLIASLLPPKKQSKLMNSLAFSSYNNNIKNKRTAFDWLSRDEDAVADYIKDPYTGYIPTARFFVDLLSGIIKMQNTKQNQNVRKDLPILFISGDEDSVGNFGKGVFEAADSYNDSGMEDITVMLFSGARHELLHEINRMEVYDVINKWLLNHLNT